MKFYENVLDLVGRTPLVKINRMCAAGSATILVKMEQLNPAGSVKDRMAVHMVRRAEEQGLLKPGSTIVESTSGNTGMGLAMAAAVRGYRCVFTIPDKMSKEKIDMLKAYGAEVVVTRTDLPHDHPDSYVEIAKRITRQTPRAFYTDQYYNMANPEAHYLTTGPEIWNATNGRITHFVAGIGTGGTFSGTAKFLKEKNKDIRAIAVDPVGSIFSEWIRKRTMSKPEAYKVEGIGSDTVTEALYLDLVDEVIAVKDIDAFETARELAKTEGISAGGSSGAAIWAARKVAKNLGADEVVVVMVPDSGMRYLSKCFNDSWMMEQGFLSRSGAAAKAVSTGE